MKSVSAITMRARFRLCFVALSLLAAPQMIWAQSDSFAFNLNSQWNLTNQYPAAPFTITVAEDAIVGGSRRITLDFEVITYKYQYVLISKPDGMYIDGFRIGGITMRLAEPAILFPETAPIGEAIPTVYGSVTLVADSVVVADRNGMERTARHYRIQWGTDRTEDFYLAPGFGPVQYQDGPGAFLYSSGTSKPPVVRTLQSYRVSACPPLSMMVNPVSTEAYSTQTLENKLQQLLELGSNMITIDATWAGLEPSPRVYEFGDIIQHIAWAKTYNMKVLLIIRTVDTVAFSVPPDLEGRAINDPTVISRFQAMLTNLAPVLEGRANFIELANEVDPFIQAHPEAVDSFKQFYVAGYSTMKALSPSSSVGIGFAYQATRVNDAVFLQLGGLGDHVAFSYYPIGANYRPTDLELVRMDFDDMLKAAGNRQLVLTETGYPSSIIVGSSQQAQDAYFRELYQTIQDAGERLAAVNLFIMNDIAVTHSEDASAYYGESDSAPFVAFLSSLGFFDETGAPKLSWTTFTTHAPSLVGNACRTTLP